MEGINKPINYIKKFTKYGTTGYILEILSDFFLPHVGELNLREKAYFVGYMVRRMLNVSLDIESPTDRDSFSYKRVELSGTLLNDLFREYYLLQKKNISTKIDKEYYYHKTKYKKTNDAPLLFLFFLPNLLTNFTMLDLLIKVIRNPDMKAKHLEPKAFLSEQFVQYLVTIF